MTHRTVLERPDQDDERERMRAEVKSFLKSAKTRPISPVELWDVVMPVETEPRRRVARATLECLHRARQRRRRGIGSGASAVGLTCESEWVRSVFLVVLDGTVRAFTAHWAMLPSGCETWKSSEDSAPVHVVKAWALGVLEPEPLTPRPPVAVYRRLKLYQLARALRLVGLARKAASS